MKLNRSMMVAVAVVLGSLGAMGCKSGQSAAPEGGDQSPVATPIEATPAAKDEAVEVKASASIGTTSQVPAVQYAPMAPPAPVYENPGRPPRADQAWINGHHRWSGREYVWVPGHWELRRDGYTYERTTWVYENGRWACHEGRWSRVENARDRMVRERMERERLERDRREHARLERQRLDHERIERARIERARQERARLEQARIERERQERAKLEQARIEKERIEKVRRDRERLEMEKAERARQEKERLAKLEASRKERDRMAQEQKAPKKGPTAISPTATPNGATRGAAKKS